MNKLFNVELKLMSPASHGFQVNNRRYDDETKFIGFAEKKKPVCTRCKGDHLVIKCMMDCSICNKRCSSDLVCRRNVGQAQAAKKRKQIERQGEKRGMEYRKEKEIMNTKV